MKLETKDLKRLQWAIAFLVIMALIGGGSVWSTQQLKKSGEKTFIEATVARKDIESKLARARVEEQELRGKINRFQALKGRGYIGPEQRLDWVETIARVKAARRLLKLDYEFSPQRPVDAGILPGGASAGGFEIMASQMRRRSSCCTRANCWRFLQSCATRCRRWCKSAPAASNALRRAAPIATTTPS